MKLHILSDLHVEFAAFVPPGTDAEVVVLAGDIDCETKGIYWARSAFPDKTIVYVPGNHEYYCTDRPEALAAIRVAAQECSVHLLDNDEVVIHSKITQESVRFLGCTLWTDFNLFGRKWKSPAILFGQLNWDDFRLIHEGGRFFSPEYSIELHEKSLAWLQERLNTPFDGKTVVVTHHLPSARSVANRFKEDWLSACFASELDYLFGKMSLWIHGHTHVSLRYEVKGTRVICNPRGYVTYRYEENVNFNPALVVNV